MNILFLTTHLNTGGITSYLLTLSKGLVCQGHRVFIVSSGGDMMETLSHAGVEHYVLDIRTKSELNPKIYFALNPLAEFIRENAIDVLHSQTRVTQVMGTLLSRKTGVAHVATCHGFFKPHFFRRLFPFWGEKTIAISPQVKVHLQHDFKTPEENVFLIPNGIETGDFFPVVSAEREKRRLELGITGNPVLGIIARLSDVKGHNVLLAAMPQILEKFPHAQLLIIGEGKIGEDLRRQARELGIQASVLFYPVVNRTMDFLVLFDVFVMPSLQEGLGLAVMEAQAAALPVVASRVGGLPSLIANHVTGVLVEPNDPQGLAEGVLFVLQNPQKAQVMGTKARSFIEREFSATTMVNKTLDVYKQVTVHGKNPRR